MPEVSVDGMISQSSVAAGKRETQVLTYPFFDDMASGARDMGGFFPKQATMGLSADFVVWLSPLWLLLRSSSMAFIKFFS
jgi:hypothetical protein